jgi:excisionase family DNA binding protein
VSTRLLTIEETAERLNIPTATLRYWRSKRSGPSSLKLNGTHVRYDEAVVEAWIKDQAADVRKSA